MSLVLSNEVKVQLNLLNPHVVGFSNWNLGRIHGFVDVLLLIRNLLLGKY